VSALNVGIIMNEYKIISIILQIVGVFAIVIFFWVAVILVVDIYFTKIPDSYNNVENFDIELKDAKNILDELKGSIEKRLELQADIENIIMY